MTRTALILETNPVITERYLDYTHESDWRIMLKDTLNEFLEKLQQEQFSLIVAEESLLPQGIIQMMRSTGIPFLLSTNTKNPEIPTLPRNFNRTELLTVFDRLVPQTQEDKSDESANNDKADENDLFSGLEDEEEETFELTSDAVIGKAEKQNAAPEINLETDQGNDFFEDDGSLFEDAGRSVEFKPEDTMRTAVFQDEEAAEGPAEEPVEEPAAEPMEEPAEEPIENAPIPQENPAGEGPTDNDPVKAAVKEWLDKNARNIIKEIVLEQLASLSGKNND